MTTFNDFSLSKSVHQALDHMGYETPTPIQAESIPLILDNKDILASAQTGTGKTGAFCIPIVTRLEENHDDFALILTPTRELAAQIFDVSQQLIKHVKKLRAGLFIGGVPINKQISHLKSNPRLLVATPGRVIDLLERGVLNLKAVRYLVLDETDRMLDMGFGIQIDEIVKRIPKERQTLLFSATIPKQIESLSKKYLTSPKRISMEVTSKPADNLIQDVMMVREVEKYDTLLAEVSKREGTMIIFTKTKRGADKVAKKLYEEGFAARAMHGDLRQQVRTRILKMFRDKKCRILVATDVAARGLDVDHVEHVINYDITQVPQDYIHRIGRTARAGAKGHALSLVSPRDEHLWRNIEHFLKSDGSETYDSKPQRKRGGRGRKPRPGGNGRGRSRDGRGPKKQYKASGGRSSRDRDGASRDGNKDRKRGSKSSRQSGDARGPRKESTKRSFSKGGRTSSNDRPSKGGRGGSSSKYKTKSSNSDQDRRKGGFKKKTSSKGGQSAGPKRQYKTSGGKKKSSGFKGKKASGTKKSGGRKKSPFA